MIDLPTWHYTVGVRLPAIIESGEIRPATAGVPAHEKPIVWCSLNQEWEETANKSIEAEDGRLIMGNKQTTHEIGGGLVRIQVDREALPLDWASFKKESGIKAREAKALFDTAVREGMSPLAWRGSFAPISSEDWLAIEVWDGEKWRPVEDIAGD